MATNCTRSLCGSVLSHIATGRDWNGHKVKQGLVVYVASEGGTGFQKRIEAFKRHYKVDSLPSATRFTHNTQIHLVREKLLEP